MGRLFEYLIKAIPRLFQGVQGSYAFGLFWKAFVRLRTAVMSPFRRVLRRLQQLVNVNLLSAKLVTPITAKVRQIMNGEPKSPEDYFTLGRFWISKALVYFLILAGCAAVFIYFNWISPIKADTTITENLITSVYYDYDDMALGEYTGKANIRAANGEVVYTGDIVAGNCTGIGTLWNQNGLLIYKGDFANNKYEGNGTVYYANGNPQYIGEFVESNFFGKGVLYYPDGRVQYEGNFENGSFSGKGVLYNESGVMIYEGEFQSGTYHGNGCSYYDTGIKKYEGEFYMGSAQGVGTSYSNSGRKIFQGQFARGDIHYEALIGCTMDTVLGMFQETPIVYYSEGGTSLLFEQAKVILEVDCLVEMKINKTESGDEDSWYLPDSSGETLTSTEDTKIEEDSDNDTEDDGEDDELAKLPVNQYLNIYYYLSSDEWQREGELDWSLVNITAVSTYRSGLKLDFLNAYEMIPKNGEAALQECVAIEKIRLKEPTAFSTIHYELTIRNRTHIEVSGINLAEAMYEEVYELENVRYRLCYQADEPNELKFITMETY